MRWVDQMSLSMGLRPRAEFMAIKRPADKLIGEKHLSEFADKVLAYNKSALR